MCKIQVSLAKAEMAGQGLGTKSIEGRFEFRKGRETGTVLIARMRNKETNHMHVNKCSRWRARSEIKNKNKKRIRKVYT